MKTFILGDLPVYLSDALCALARALPIGRRFFFRVAYFFNEVSWTTEDLKDGFRKDAGGEWAKACAALN